MAKQKPSDPKNPKTKSLEKTIREQAAKIKKLQKIIK